MAEGNVPKPPYLSRTAPSSHNFNDFTTDGDIFWVNPSWTNGPGVMDNGFIFVHEYSGYITQIFSNIAGVIKARGYNSATGWSQWQ